MIALSIVHIRGAKRIKSQTPLVHFARLFYKLQPDRISKSGQKSIIQIFERWSCCKIIEQNIPRGLIFSGLTTMYMYYLNGLYYIVTCHIPTAPSYGGMRTWVEGSQMRGDRALARASNLLGYKE